MFIVFEVFVMQHRTTTVISSYLKTSPTPSFLKVNVLHQKAFIKPVYNKTSDWLFISQCTAFSAVTRLKD
jgi:hypothetical protein